jgi:hypothetical protein
MRLGFLAGLMAFIAVGAQAAPDEARFTPPQLRSDFAAMYAGLKSGDYDIYAFTPKGELDEEYSRTLASLNTALTKFDAQIRFEEFASHIRQGHARVDFPYAVWTRHLKSGGKVFPLAIRVVGDKVFVAQNNSGLDAITPGDEIVAMDGDTVQTWLARAERHVSAETPYMAGTLMEYDFPIYVWVELGDVAAFDLTFRKADGALVKLRVPARGDAEMKSFAAAQPVPLSLDTPMREAKMLSDRIAYLRPGPFYNANAKTGADEWDVSGFRDFIDGAFRSFKAAGADRLIIDLRGNPGGDNLFSDVMISWFADKPFRFFSKFQVRVSPQSTKANGDRIQNDAAAAGPVSQQYARMYAGAKNGDVVDFEMTPAQPRAGERFKGKVFLLIDRQSYSNTVSVAALVQDYKFGTVLGEATSDMATTYGAMETFALPNTGIVVGFPKAHIVRPNGDLRARGVTPDMPINIPVVQTQADEVLQKAVAMVRGN